MSISPNALIPVLLACYFGWRLYIRLRRHIGKQLLQPRRIAIRIIIYCVIVLGVASTALRDASLSAGVGCGLLLGAVLALIGLRLTVFETTPEGQFFTPNTMIGIGLSALFVGRVIYRLTMIYGTASHAGPRAASFVQSPLTLLTFGLLLGYYIAYYTGVLARCSKQKAGAAQDAGAVSEI